MRRAGVLSPLLTYWISARAGNAQGWELGKQTAAAALRWAELVSLRRIAFQ